MRELLDEIEARQRLVCETAERLREQIADLTGQLTAAEQTLERLEITRESVLELATEAGMPPAELLLPGYRLGGPGRTRARPSTVTAASPVRAASSPLRKTRTHGPCVPV
ncbi:hypothetical protein ACIGMX_38365 [Streptomyces aquilus]|uniref:Uncharacterized protein n=1 Tax=Streptomyces aquilus TaxID=2548456 RepID=A0A3S5HMG5_9ACTN|nr:hypothetical protein [Streptomyces aquilus]AZP15038.1 hypothetical protein EJC51_02145 [Streptomyces aquilus]